MQTLSPKSLAQVIGVSESSLKRWADDGLLQFSRTAGGHRRIDLPEAIAYIRRAGMPVKDPAPLGLPELNLVSGAAGRGVPEQRLVAAVSDGDVRSARGLVLEMFLAGRSVCEICDGALTHALHAASDRYMHKSNGVEVEKRAIRVCEASLESLDELQQTTTSDAPAAVGGSLPGDPYTLASTMACSTFRADGWVSEYLGVSLPVDQFVNAARERRAALVWVSVSVASVAEICRPMLAELAERLGRLGAKLIVGGRALPPRTSLAMPNLQVITTMSELAAFARGECSVTSKTGIIKSGPASFPIRGQH